MRNNNKLTVAVLLVSYNQQDYIHEALEGIRLQTRTPDEVIIADDGSTDNTHEIIINYVKIHKLESSWKLILSSKNKGINENLNNGIKYVKSEIIVPMAGDDVSLENRCELAEKLFIEHGNINIINTNGFIINENGEITGHTFRPVGIHKDVAKSIRNGFPPISPVGECWRTKIFGLIGELPTDVPNEDDQISFCGLINGGILCSGEKTFKYRVHKSSASAWLRNNQSNKKFLIQYLRDMEIRRRHMMHWVVLLSKSANPDREHLKMILEKKIRFYALMSMLESGNFGERILFFIRNGNVLPFREKVYCILGRQGVVFWRVLRKIIKGNK